MKLNKFPSNSALSRLVAVGLLLAWFALRAAPVPLTVVPDGNASGIQGDALLLDPGNGHFWSWPLDSVREVDEELTLPLPWSASPLDRSWGNHPLAFERNEGQLNSEVSFLTRRGDCRMFLTSAGLTMALLPDARSKVPCRLLRMRLVGANTSATVRGEGKLAGKINYFLGNKPAGWHTNISTFARVCYQGVYPGIGLVYHGNNHALEYDFVVGPGADPKVIALDFEGADDLEIEPEGDLRLTIGQKEMHWCRPRVFQQDGSHSQEISAGYVLEPVSAESLGRKVQRVRFEVAAYDLSLPLIIDPVLVYSTYLGGSSAASTEQATTADQDGNAYVTGLTGASDFPTTNAFQTFYYGMGDAFVTKFSPRGELVFSTYLGGSGRENNLGPNPGIAVDRTGSVYVVGHTTSSDFPLMNAFQSYFAGAVDGFVCKLTPDGAALVYSTYLGGPGGDYAECIAVDDQGCALIGGTAMAGFPTVNALFPQNAGGGDGFVAKLTPAGDALVYSTFLGSSVEDAVLGVTVDATGNAFVCGYAGAGFPVTSALQPAAKGGWDGFVTKLNADGSQLMFSTLYGGRLNDWGRQIGIGPDGDLYVSFETSSPDFPTVNPFQANYMGAGDAAAVRMKSDGSSVVYSTFLGGSGGEHVSGSCVDGQGNFYISGSTGSTNFPLYNPLQLPSSGPGPSFLSVLSHDGSALLFSTFYFGEYGDGLAVDPTGSVYVAGSTSATNLWVTNAFQPTLMDGTDAFVTKFSSLVPPQVQIKRSGTMVVIAWPVSASDFTLESSSALGASATWSPATQVPQVVADQNVLVLDTTNATQFFRLRK